jgi:hypothetical protein
MIFYSYSGV